MSAAESEKLVPFLLDAVNINDAHTKVSCMGILKKLITDKPGMLESHLDSLVNRMTDRTHNTLVSPSDASIDCRGLALDCLSLIASKMPSTLTLPRKNRVIAELDIALDDPSRTVRGKAERAKMVWMNLEAAEEAS